MTLNLSGAYVGNWPNQQLKWSVCLAGFMFANESTSNMWGSKGTPKPKSLRDALL